MADSYTTLNTMLMANHIPPATAEQIICDTLRFLQFQRETFPFFRKKDYRVIYPQKIRTDLLHQQHCHCAICNELITDHAELDHIIPWKYVGDELDNNLQLLCFTCNRSKKASPLYQLRMLLRTGKAWSQTPA